MKLAKRILLFAAVNILVVVSISAILGVLGVSPYLSARGIDYSQLMAFCLVWGFGGALISLALSRVMARWMMGVQLIDERTTDPELQWLHATVHQLARSAGLGRMPQVGVYESGDLNAFATGPTSNRALVAVSTGLLRRMRPEQIEGVLGHEIAHIANGDMVTLTLIQGVVNAFVMFLARIAAFFIGQSVREESRPAVQFVAVLLLELTLGFFGMLVVAAFSRWREFRADHGGARLAGRDKMVSALQALRNNLHGPQDDAAPALAAFKISGRKPGGFLALLSTHPPLDERIRRLQGA